MQSDQATDAPEQHLLSELLDQLIVLEGRLHTRSVFEVIVSLVVDVVGLLLVLARWPLYVGTQATPVHFGALAKALGIDLDHFRLLLRLLVGRVVQPPSVVHHQFEILVVVDRCRDVGLLLQELWLGHLPIVLRLTVGSHLKSVQKLSEYFLLGLLSGLDVRRIFGVVRL